jgi:hypothetical protein
MGIAVLGRTRVEPSRPLLAFLLGATCQRWIDLHRHGTVCAAPLCTTPTPAHDDARIILCPATCVRCDWSVFFTRTGTEGRSATW